jgi:hypothetical protein
LSIILIDESIERILNRFDEVVVVNARRSSAEKVHHDQQAWLGDRRRFRYPCILCGGANRSLPFSEKVSIVGLIGNGPPNHHEFKR